MKTILYIACIFVLVFAIGCTSTKHSQDEINLISNRFENADKKILFELCREHELDGVVAGFAIEHGLNLPDYWINEYHKKKNHL